MRHPIIRLSRPAIITRRALVTGAAALAMAPREVRAVTTGWNPADKNSAITLSDDWHLGTNSVFIMPTSSGYVSARSNWSFSSGKWVVYLVTKQQANSGRNVGAILGVGNASANLNTYAGGDANGWGTQDGYILHNGGVAATINGGSNGFYNGSQQVLALAINASASPKRLHFYNWGSSSSGDPRRNSGWVDGTGTASDPTNNSSGQDISALGSPLYLLGSGVMNTSYPLISRLNLGDWPGLVEGIPIPAGYSQPNAAISMPAGSYTLTNNSNPSDTVVGQNGMRYVVTSGVGSNGVASTPAFPANRKFVFSVHWDYLNLFPGGDAQVGFSGTGVSSSTASWQAGGSSQNMGGASTPGWAGGDDTYIAVNWGVGGLYLGWISLDAGATWLGNGGASPNPATGVNGVDISGLASRANAGATIILGTDTRTYATMNCGRFTDTQFTMPAGYTWLDPISTQHPVQRGLIL